MKQAINELCGLTPAEMAERTGVSIDTLRYYRGEGLIRSIQRNPSGHRRYSADDVMWIEVLRCLRATNMSIEQLRHYCNLGGQGDHTQPERLQLLMAHKEKIEQKISDMQAALALIDHKIGFYQQAINQENQQ